MNRIGKLTALCVASFAFALGIASVPSSARAGTDTFLGEIMLVPYNFCPKGYLEANGQLQFITQNQPLFSLLGVKYGGNGSSTFGLPAIRPPIPANGPALRACIATQGIFPSRN